MCSAHDREAVMIRAVKRHNGENLFARLEDWWRIDSPIEINVRAVNLHIRLLDDVRHTAIGLALRDAAR